MSQFKKVGIFLSVVSIALAVLIYSIRSADIKKLNKTTASNLQEQLTQYKTQPNMQKLRDILQSLDNYVLNNGEHKEITPMIKSIKENMLSYCKESPCNSFKSKHEEIEAERENLKSLRSLLDDKEVMRKSFVCTRIFEKHESDFLVDCTDVSSMKRSILIINEDSARVITLGQYYTADVKDQGVQGIKLYNGSVEYFPYYKEVPIDYNAIRQSENKIKTLESSLFGSQQDYEDALDNSWNRVAISVEKDLKKTANAFGLQYTESKQVLPADFTIDENFEVRKRKRTEQILFGVNFVIDSRDVMLIEDPAPSTIIANGKLIASSEDYAFFLQEAIEANNGGLLLYSESGGGSGCNNTFKGVIVKKDKSLRNTPVLGYCDTTFEINGDFITTKSEKAAIKCNFKVDIGEVNCRSTKS